MASKIPKSAAGYLPAKLIGTERVGTFCSKCRDFIRGTSECLIVFPPRVDGEFGTCTQFLKGDPYINARPLKLVPKETVGYIEGPEVPTFCGRCEYYAEKGRMSGPCEKVEGKVDYAGCCNLYEADEKVL